MMVTRVRIVSPLQGSIISVTSFPEADAPGFYLSPLPGCNMRTDSLFGLRRIWSFPTRVNLPYEVRIAHRMGFDQVHFPTKQRPQSLPKTKVRFVVSRRVQWQKFNEKIKVTRIGVEGAVCGGPEDFESLHVMFSAKGFEVVHLCVNDISHGSSLRPWDTSSLLKNTDSAMMV